MNFKSLMQKIKRAKYERTESNNDTVVERREFLERALTWTFVVSVSWLATDLAQHNLSQVVKDDWLEDHYKSDFIGV